MKPHFPMFFPPWRVSYQTLKVRAAEPPARPAICSTQGREPFTRKHQAPRGVMFNFLQHPDPQCDVRKTSLLLPDLPLSCHKLSLQQGSGNCACKDCTCLEARSLRAGCWLLPRVPMHQLGYCLYLLSKEKKVSWMVRLRFPRQFLLDMVGFSSGPFHEPGQLQI